MRLDKWLWATRFYKTRALAAEHAARGQVCVNGQLAKPGREIKLGDLIAMRYSAFNVPLTRSVTVLGLPTNRGSAPVSQTHFSETDDSKQARDKAFAERHLHQEPAHSITGGRPSKRDRRDLTDWQQHEPVSWDSRWSATLE